MTPLDSAFSLDGLFWGLIIGLAIGLLVYIREYLKRLSLQAEIRALQKNLHQKLEFDVEALQAKNRELEELRRRNENLRISLKSLQQKPGRAEMLQFQVYQKAIDQMTSLAPGFVPLWQKSLDEAQQSIQAAQDGRESFVKRMVRLPFFRRADNDSPALPE